MITFSLISSKIRFLSNDLKEDFSSIEISHTYLKKLSISRQKCAILVDAIDKS